MLEGIGAYGVAKKLGQTTKAQQFLGALYTTADYFLGCNSLNMTWVTGLGPRHPNQVFHIDSWLLGYHDGIVPYGPWKTETLNPSWVTDHDYANQTCYPACSWSNWPANERWHDNRWSPMSSEFTLSQTIAPSAALFGFLCAPGPEASAAPKPAPLRIGNTGSNAALITWPSSSTGGMILQQTADLTSGGSNWLTYPLNIGGTNRVRVPQVPADDGTNRSVAVPLEAATNMASAFRLKWP